MRDCQCSHHRHHPCKWHPIAFFSTSIIYDCFCFVWSSICAYSVFSVQCSVFTLWRYLFTKYKTSKIPIPNKSVLIYRNLLLNWVLQNRICNASSSILFVHCSTYRAVAFPGTLFFHSIKSNFDLGNTKCTFIAVWSRWVRVCIIITRAISQTQDLAKRSWIRLSTKHLHIITSLWLMHCEWHDGWWCY